MVLVFEITNLNHHFLAKICKLAWIICIGGRVDAMDDSAGSTTVCFKM